MNQGSLTSQRHLFDLPDSKGGLIYLNGAARSPMMKHVLAVGTKALGQQLKPWTMKNEAENRTKELFAKLIDSKTSDIAITPCTSHAISLIAHNAMKTGKVSGVMDAVLVLQNQMSSNVLPWQHLCKSTGAELLVAPAPSKPGKSWTDSVLSLDWKKVKIVAMPPVLWTDGSVLDMEIIAEKCTKNNAWLVVDGTQALGAMPLSVSKLKIDFLCASVHKWLHGPYGACLLYANPKLVDKMVGFDHHERIRIGSEGDKDLPFLCGSSNAENGYEMRYRPGALRLQAGGRPNPVLLPMVAEGLAQVMEWGVERVASMLRIMTSKIQAGAAAMGYLIPPQPSAPHIIGLRVPKSWNCKAIDCVEFLDEHKIMVSERLGVIRISPSVYNTDKEVESLLVHLRKFSLQHVRP